MHLNALGWVQMHSDGCRSESSPFSVVNQFHLDQAYQLLTSDEHFTELLTLDLLPSDQGQEPAVAAQDIDPVITEAIEVVPLVEGNIPPECPEQREYSTTASPALGLDNQEEYTRLGRYLHEGAVGCCSSWHGWGLHVCKFQESC